ncbi:hypothetical protein SAMN05444365_101358 [Micromonospora pattaloongensis]|uniref:Uncharacterized protein n=1 Tax=Micromonospora pattaloongensis TaxID=405436 RepID=A0A1H3GBX2_9ACTN|nr:hypothetical protein [Micromonospora pattaloongensis]SDY00842.1 hypothetical protein SAMN05444365_101358 [Micromonospora pattaloongensis]
MSPRLQTAKPKLALWMLVAVADVVLLVASVGLATLLLAIAGVATVAVAAAGAFLLLRRGVPERRVPARVVVPASTRRRM